MGHFQRTDTLGEVTLLMHVVPTSRKESEFISWVVTAVQFNTALLSKELGDLQSNPNSNSCWQRFSKCWTKLFKRQEMSHIFFFISSLPQHIYRTKIFRWFLSSEDDFMKVTWEQFYRDYAEFEEDLQIKGSHLMDRHIQETEVCWENFPWKKINSVTLES